MTLVTLVIDESPSMTVEFIKKGYTSKDIRKNSYSKNTPTYSLLGVILTHIWKKYVQGVCFCFILWEKTIKMEKSRKKNICSSMNVCNCNP